MAKIRVLVLNSDSDGVGYWRTLCHVSMFDPEVEVDIRLLTDGTIPLVDEGFLSNYNIIVYNKTIPFRTSELSVAFSEILKRRGIKIVYDIDDHWVLDHSHINYELWKKNGSGAMVEKILRSVDAVTTTTPIFAEEIRPLNPNVHVMENGVNVKEQQWNPRKVQSDKVRFLWGGGISHMPDLKLLKEDFRMFDEDFRRKSQLYLCGFDLRVKTPQGMVRDNPKRSQWSMFEAIFTNGGRWIDNPTYAKWLNQFDPGTDYGRDPRFRGEFYQRRWTRDILHYGEMYNEADVTLAPLKDGIRFNLVKSQLKVIESGIHGCPIIASDIGPYRIDIEDGKDGFLIPEGQPGLWYEKMKWFVDNPNAVTEMGQRLQEKVKMKFDIDVIHQKRINLYKSLLSVG